MLKLNKRYNLPVGLSDHTLGLSASVAAVALGAVVIEKHFTLSRRIHGSDAKHSLQPKEFKMFVKEIRDIEKTVSSVVEKDTLAEELKDMKIIFEKSVVAKQFISKGTNIAFDMITFKKPGDGIRADRYKEILEKRAKIDIPQDTKIKKEMLE
jgi:N-acetylneuraminate synthase